MPGKCLYRTALLLCAALPVLPLRADVLVEVNAGEYDRVSTPISIKLHASLKKHEHFTLTRLDTDKSVPIQVTAGETPHVVWLLDTPLAAETTRLYRLTPSDKPTAPGRPVAVEDDGKHLRITVGGKPVLVYNTAMVLNPDRAKPYYDRSGYIHPLFNPSGHWRDLAEPPQVKLSGVKAISEDE